MDVRHVATPPKFPVTAAVFRWQVFAWFALGTFAVCLAVLWLAHYSPGTGSSSYTPTGTTGHVTRVDTTPMVDALHALELEQLQPAHPSTTVPPATGRPFLEQLVRRTFPEDPVTAFAIVNAESAWDPAAVSATWDYGLFQINAVHMRPGEAADGYTPSDLLDPIINATVARRIYDNAGGWFPWSTYRHFRTS